MILVNLLVAFVTWSLFSLLFLFGVTRVFDLKLVDLRFRLRGERPASESVAVVGVDDETITAYNSWPISRDTYALLLSAIMESGAASVGVDFQFASDNGGDPKFDALLAYVSAKHPGIVQSMAFHAAEPGPEDPSPPADLLDRLHAHGIETSQVPASTAGNLSLPYPQLAEEALALGHTNVAIDPDGAIRRIPFFIKYQGRLYSALSLRVFCAAKGMSFPPDLLSTRDGVELRFKDGSRLRLPMDEDGCTAIDYAGDSRAFPHVYSMLQVLGWYREGDHEKLRQAFEGRMVMLGLTSEREVTEDIGTTPFSATTPLIYVHANALDGCLQGRFLRRIPSSAYVVLLALLALGLGAVYARAALPKALLVAVGGVILVAGADQMLFVFSRIDVPPSLLLALPMVSYLAHGSVRHLFLERRSREREADVRAGKSVQQQFMPDALVGQTLSHYSVTGLLGRGGMGVVYQGKDTRLRRPVAIKVLQGGGLADEQARRRFRREWRALSKLSHPYIAMLYDFDTQDGTDFLVLEYVEGKTLAQRLLDGRLEEDDLARIGIQIAEGLRSAHEHGIVHRDLKPGNIMISDAGFVKILDFGLARIWQASGDSTTTAPGLTATGMMVGTIPYMAPEILRGGEPDIRVDVYGVGMILYEAATGRRPFIDDAPHELMYTILNQEPPEPRVLNRKISTAMQSVILKAIEKDPGQRHQSVTEILAELAIVQQNLGKR